MSKLQKVAAYKTSDDKLHLSLDSARCSLLRELIDEAVAKASTQPTQDMSVHECYAYAEQVFYDCFDQVTIKLEEIMRSVR